MQKSNLESARDALQVGHFRRALENLEGAGSSDPQIQALRAEVYLLQGRPELARRIALELLANKLGLPTAMQAQALYVAGAAAWELSKNGESAKLDKAIQLAEDSREAGLAARVRLHMLERVAESGADYQVSLPLCAAALRAVHRAANRLVFTEAHVAFARIEARLGRVHLAGRHIALANGLLKETPNLWLDASARLTNAIVFSVQGDLQTACELAEAAGRDAARAGWLKGEAVAAANLAYFHACAGRIAESKRYIGQASSIGYLPPSYACALLDTRTIVAFADSDFSEADRLWSEGQESVGRVAYWYWMRCAHTRVRGLIRQDRFPEALEIAQKYKSQADQLRNNYFSYVFGLSIAQLEANNGRPIHLPTDVVAPSDCSLGLIGARKQVLAQGACPSGIRESSDRDGFCTPNTGSGRM